MNQMLTETTGIAALDCSLQGGYLIEASAGTGKTWTLTGIILRLLIEKGYAPERIVATTFTRAAASEMQERIGERLQNFYALLRWLKQSQATYPQWFTPNQDEKLHATIHEEIKQSARLSGLEADDPINDYLLSYIRKQPGRFLDEILHRTAFLLTSLDKLFVGTLDSLAQKWLREFAVQIGHQPDAQVLKNAQMPILQIVHDRLRAKESWLKHHDLALYHFIKFHRVDFFSDAQAMASSIENALHFFNAPIDPVPSCNFSLADTNQELQNILQADYQSILKYTNKDYCKDIGIGQSKGTLAASLDCLPELLELLNIHGIYFTQYVQDRHIKLFERAKDPSNARNFNKKCSQDDQENFISQNWDLIGRIEKLFQQITEIFYHFCASVRVEIAQALRQDLAFNLELQGQTTFTLQMVRLNTALRNNPALAKYIRHHYPVALIDESQDVNGLQVELLEKIYLKPLLEYQKKLQYYQEFAGEKPKTMRGFLLFVGDPKQAIYRFRGGDVSNYNLIKFYGQDECKTPILKSDLVLDVNRRSNAALIDSLNIWFMDNQQTDLKNHAYLGTKIYYRQIQAFEQQQKLSWQQISNHKPSYLGGKPLSVLHFTHADKDIMDIKIAEHINSLLQGSHTIDGLKIQPSDIAILSRNRNDAQGVKQALTNLGIFANAAAEQNVFTTPAAQDLYHLLDAVLHSTDTAKLGSLLTSGFFGLSLTQAMTILNDQGGQIAGEDVFVDKADILNYLKKIHERWQKYGLASALNYALLQPPLKNNLWLNAAKLGERYLVDLTQLIELVGLQKQLHELYLLTWYQLQMQLDDIPEEYVCVGLPHETGVQIMTIHKSKGLEFPIVYVMGLAKAPRPNDDNLIAYSEENFHRRLSAVVGPTKDALLFLHHQESIEEERRLAYVALTRASQQVFIIAKDEHNKSALQDRALYQWLENTDNAKLSTPARLQDEMDWIELADCTDLIDKKLVVSKTQKHRIDYVDWQSLIQKRQFVGYYKTSFTALISQLDRSTRLQQSDRPDYDDIALITDVAVDYTSLNSKTSSDTTQTDPTQNIQASFIRGMGAGDFLHKVLQFTQSDDELSFVIDEQLRRLGLPNHYASTFIQMQQMQQMQQAQPSNHIDLHGQLVEWLLQVRYAKLQASNTCLARLDLSAQVRELSFTLGLSENFSINKLNDVFQQHSDKDLSLLTHDTELCYRYLRGEIDLVYEWQGKFYIVDYKSNYLGESIEDYHQQALQDAMDKSGYWLQAAIYQVALHRLLKLRIKDYLNNEEKYLGPVEYLFLRGVVDGREDVARMVWQVPLNLVLALDEIL